MELMGTLVVGDKSGPIRNVMMLTGLEELGIQETRSTNVNAQIENLIGSNQSTNHSKTGYYNSHQVAKDFI